MGVSRNGKSLLASLLPPTPGRTYESESIRCSAVRLFATPWIARQAPLSTGFPRQEYWSGYSISFSRRPSQPECPALQVDSLQAEPPRGPVLTYNHLQRGRQFLSSSGTCLVHPPRHRPSSAQPQQACPCPQWHFPKKGPVPLPANQSTISEARACLKR